MGLDMYMFRVKRINDASLADISLVNDYLDWKGKGGKYTFEEWCGKDVNKVNMQLVNKYLNHHKDRYSNWDTDKKYPYKSIMENICYWRKANQIHDWLVENVQDGNDNCEPYEVTKEKLEELLNVCKRVKAASDIGAMSVAEEILPPSSGFFFGSTEFDEYYLSDVNYTIDMFEKIIKETDFDKEIIFYESSW